MCLFCPLPARAASVHLALLPLRAALPADHVRKPSHLQNAPLQSHPPRSQPGLLPENEEKGLGEQEGRTEAKGAETLWQLNSQLWGHPTVHPQEPPPSLNSGTHNCAAWGHCGSSLSNVTQAQHSHKTSLLPAGCRLGIQHSTLEQSPFALELSFPKSTQVT